MSNSNITEVKLIDTTYYSMGYPSENLSQLIPRSNYYTLIDSCLIQNLKLTFIEGEEDSGKTTLCAQYAKINRDNTVTVFFNQLNKLDYTLEYFYSNLVNQFKYLLNVPIDVNENISVEIFNQYFIQIRKLTRKNNKPITLIIDGLEQQILSKTEFLKTLVPNIPIGTDLFNVIIVGDEDVFKNTFFKGKNISSKTITLSGFSDSEIEKYLNIDVSTKTDYKDLYKVTKGFPGRLRTLKRLVETEGYELEQISKSTTYKSWIELECSSIDLSNPSNSVILSLLSLSEEAFMFEEVVSITTLSVEVIDAVIKECDFLEFKNKYLNFVSASHKLYFSNILRGNKKKIRDLLISYYANADNISSLLSLPKLYSENNNWVKVIDVLNEEFSRRIIQSTESKSSVIESLSLGIQATKNASNYPEMWRYSLEAGLINEMDNFLFWESEVTARIALGDFAGAITLAQSAVLKVDRLKMLVSIARSQKESKKYMDEDLLALIKQTYDTTDIRSLGERVYDIVADLIYVMPNMAIGLIEKSSGYASDNNINDWIITKLSIAAIDSSIKEKEDPDTSKTAQALQNLNNPEIKKIHKAVAFLVGNYDGQKVMDEVNRLSESSEKLRLIRIWLTNKFEYGKENDRNLGMIIGMGLNEAVASSSKEPILVEVLKDLSFQLPYVTDLKIKDELYYRFKHIEKNVSELGSVRNNFIYKLNLFHALYTIDIQDSIRVVNGIISEIEKIDDLLVKVEAYAETYNKLFQLNSLEFNDKVNFIYSRLMMLSQAVYNETAHHFILMKNVLKAVGKVNPAFALKICDGINLKSRREEGRMLILRTYLKNKENIDLQKIHMIEESLEGKENVITLYLSTLERFAEAKTLKFQTIQSLFYYLEKSSLIKDPRDRCFIYVQSYIIIAKNQDWFKKLSKKYETEILKAWNQIESEWDKIDIGFVISSQTAEISDVFAKEIFAKTEKIREQNWLDSRRIADTYLTSLKIVIRSFVNLMIIKDFSKDDELIVEDLINRIPSESKKLELWSEIGLYCFSLENEKYGKAIFNQKVIPLIQGLRDKNISLVPVINSLTFIYINNKEIFKKYIEYESPAFIELVYNNICEFYVTRRNPYEIYDEKINTFDTPFSDLMESLSVLNNMKTDYSVYYHFHRICNSIRDNKSEITKLQSSELVTMLEKIAAIKFPDKINIKHNGYVILCKFKIGQIKRDVQINMAFYRNIFEEAKSIPNGSDRLYVMSIIFEELPIEKSGTAFQMEIFNEINRELEKLTTHFEFVQRVIDITDRMYKFNRNKWKETVNKAVSVCFALDKMKDTYESQKRIIDSIYRMDPNYAKEIIHIIELKGNKASHIKLIQNHLKSLEIEKKIANSQIVENKDLDDKMNIIRGLVKAIKGINSGNVSPKKIQEASEYLDLSISLPLQLCYPIYIYYLVNCSKTYRSKETKGPVENIHRWNFKKAVKATNLIELLSYRNRSGFGNSRNYFIEEEFANNKVIKPGTREEAIAYIQSWIEDEVEEFIVISDPYFSAPDIEILKIIKNYKPDIEINILGSKEGKSAGTEEKFKDMWSKISNESPPFANFTFCWIPGDNNQTPFHDRYMISKNSGLRLGSSLNSLGLKKDSEISVMNSGDSKKVLNESLLELISRKKRDVNNNRISYNSFSF